MSSHMVTMYCDNDVAPPEALEFSTIIDLMAKIMQSRQRLLENIEKNAEWFSFIYPNEISNEPAQSAFFEIQKFLQTIINTCNMRGNCHHVKIVDKNKEMFNLVQFVNKYIVAIDGIINRDKEMCVITRGGELYHRRDMACGYLSRSRKILIMTVDNAIKEGYGRCRCMSRFSFNPWIWCIITIIICIIVGILTSL